MAQPSSAKHQHQARLEALPYIADFIAHLAKYKYIRAQLQKVAAALPDEEKSSLEASALKAQANADPFLEPISSIFRNHEITGDKLEHMLEKLTVSSFDTASEAAHYISLAVRQVQIDKLKSQPETEDKAALEKELSDLNDKLIDSMLTIGSSLKHLNFDGPDLDQMKDKVQHACRDIAAQLGGGAPEGETVH